MESVQPATTERVSAVRRQFQAWLEPLRLGVESALDLAVALTEATTNAVEHGSPRGELDSFHVSCRIEQQTLVMEVIDHGPGFDFQGVPRPDPLALEERGRGIWLMASVTDRLAFHREPGGMRVRLEKDLRCVEMEAEAS